MALESRWYVLLGATVAAVLVPFFLWGERIEAETSAFLSSAPGLWTAALVLAAVLALDIVLPIPSSLVSTAAGGLLGFLPGLFTSWVGMTVGAAAGYWLGQRARNAGAVREADIARVERARDRWGDWALLVMRPVPVLAEASVFLAGVAGIPARRFLPLTIAANLGISAAYAAAGAYARGRESFLLAFAGAIAIPGLAMLAARTLRPAKGPVKA